MLTQWPSPAPSPEDSGQVAVQGGERDRVGRSRGASERRKERPNHGGVREDVPFRAQAIELPKLDQARCNVHDQNHVQRESPRTHAGPFSSVVFGAHSRGEQPKPTSASHGRETLRSISALL